jgi:aspartyl-tRNA(Asn)/glutamyl-tRNA(Gln) amidotransferase subunit A
MNSDLTQLGIAAAAAGLREKTFSAVELAQAHLAAIEDRDSELHSYLAVNGELALDHAREVDQALAAGEALSPLAGIPLAVKDNFAVHGFPATSASKILAGVEPAYEATAVARLRAAGATILGKTNLDEFAMGASTEYSAYGPTKNPVDPTRVPGGSSGGSAAAVAANLAVAALASDTGGSIRQPAGFCGVVGLKPTYGRVSRSGLYALTSSTDCVGTLARSVDDAAHVLQVIAGRDRRDASSSNEPLLDVESYDRLDGVRFGLPREYFAEGLDSRISDVIHATVEKLKALGATVTEVSLPHTSYALAAYYIITPAEASSNLARYDGIRFGDSVLRESGAHTLADAYAVTRDRSMGAEPKRRIMLGTYALSAGYADRYYKKAQAVCELIRRDFDQAFETVDALITPITPTLPFLLGEIQEPLAMYLADIYTVAANVSGVPGLSLPVGKIDGLPVGMQLMTPSFTEHRLLGLGRVVERVVA